jgi:hypothetical protein
VRFSRRSKRGRTDGRKWLGNVVIGLHNLLAERIEIRLDPVVEGDARPELTCLVTSSLGVMPST